MFKFTRQLVLSFLMGIPVLFLILIPFHAVLAEEVEEVAKWIGSDVDYNDQFGFSVSVSGDTAMIGARFEDVYVGDPPITPVSVGAVYAYVRSGTWKQQDMLMANDWSSGSNFGYSVSVDGEHVLIGSPTSDDNGLNSGSAYFFERLGEEWFQRAKVTASDAVAGSYFGWSVSMDGEYAVIGADTDNAIGFKGGAAYVFARSGGLWPERAKLTASDGDDLAFFGHSVSIEGNTIVVGAIGAEINGSPTGAAYVFVFNGDDWIQEAKLVPSDTRSSRFGSSVSISGDTILIGDRQADIHGTAHVFTRSTEGWIEQAKLIPSDASDNLDFFGGSVSLEGDLAVIGTLYTGSAYIFSRNGDTWTEQTKLTRNDGDWFGNSVSLDDGNVLIGAPHDDTNDFNAGAAYLFALDFSGSVSCEGFAPPMETYPISLTKKRPLPLKAELYSEGILLTDLDIASPPVVQVWLEPGVGGEAVDVTDDLIMIGKADEGNQFVYTPTGVWQFILGTKSFTAPGKYNIMMDSGDHSEYVLEPTCVTQVIVE